MAATHVRVKAQDTHTHRSLTTILGILRKIQTRSTAVNDRASAIFRKLGEAEAAVHDVPIEKIHFHEVGAVDAIVDIVGACIGFAELGFEKFACSAAERRRRHRQNGPRCSACARPRHRASASGQAHLFQWRAKRTGHAHRRGYRRHSLRHLWPAARHDRHRHRLRRGHRRSGRSAQRASHHGR